MRASLARAPLAVLAAGALTLAAATGVAQAQSGLDGYTPENAAKQQQYEARFQDGVSADDIRSLSRDLSAKPHLVGTPNQAQVTQRVLRKFRSYGLDAHTQSYDIYISRPEDIQVSMTKPYTRAATVKEKRFPWMQDYQDVVPAYNAYSPPGDVTGEVVYANYGLPEDYAELDRLGVSVAGKIVLVRYGRSFRGVKVHVAEQHGAKGVIIYSDPKDDGFTRGAVYPDGPWRPADSIQRGSIQYLWDYPGDPLTPGKPSIPGTKRLKPDQATDLARIPSTPISYGDAQPMLEALGGPEAPESFQGGLAFRYHVGPGPTEAHLNLKIAYDTEKVTDVIADVRGTKHPDQKVMVGGHSDAWTYGTNDNVSGLTATMEIGRSLGKLLERGWHPDRTIELAAWDGEEYGLLGSTEFGEQFAKAQDNVVGYLNMDIVSGRSFSAGGVPSTDKLLMDTSKTIPDPSGKSVYDAWRGNAPAPTPERLGSGSDYTVFLDHLGVPSMVVGESTPGGEYHSAYDDTRQTEMFLDPGYLGHQTASRASGVTALRLANADALPLRYSDYAKAVDGYVAELQQIQASNPDTSSQVPLTNLRKAAQDWGTASSALEAHAADLVSDNSPPQGQLNKVNRALMTQERQLLTSGGIPGRPWFRHQVYAPGINTGYAAQFLPGIRDALDAGDDATVAKYRDLLIDSLHAATRTAQSAGGGAQATAVKVRGTARAARRSAAASVAEQARP
jgi:N-acetylated-alpha-linked acidic dipeptidase